LHNAGDNVLDDNGKPIIKHRKGDVILDSDNKPIIDFINGLTHNFNILLLEDGFSMANNDIYKEYIITYLKELTTILDTTIPYFNNELLEGTTYKFLPLNSPESIKLKDSDGYKIYDNFIIPTITISILKETNFILTDDLENKLSLTLQNMLMGNTNINTIENKLHGIVGDEVISVRLTDITKDNINNIMYNKNSSIKIVVDFL